LGEPLEPPPVSPDHVLAGSRQGPLFSVVFVQNGGQVRRKGGDIMAPRSPHHDERSQQRFLRLFLASEPELRRYVAVLVPNLDDAQEVIQQTAAVLWEKFDKYDPALPFTPWACRFALNVSKQWLARQQRWSSILREDFAMQLIRRRDALEPQIDGRLRHLENCVGKLPPAQRSLVEGYYSRRVGVDRLSEESGRSVDAVYKALQRIRHVLQLCIEQAVHEEAAT
jgi:RNA polymerase sigma-70 factor (ECF subfamily)